MTPSRPTSRWALARGVAARELRRSLAARCLAASPALRGARSTPETEASSEHTSRQSVNSPSRPKTTNATTSKTFISTMAAAAIKRYIHQSTHDTSSKLEGFPLCDVLPRTRLVPRLSAARNWYQDARSAGSRSACEHPTWIRPHGRYRLARELIFTRPSEQAPGPAVSPDVARPGVTTSQGAPAARHARTPGHLEGTPHIVGQRDPYG